VEIYDKVAEKDIGFTDAQYDAVKQLIADIRRRWPGINHNRRHIVGHNEYAPDRRSDPGELFDWRRMGLE
jgi:N-acetyl-anhydromuramyl-L-alanine amidase AmpD